MKATSLTNLVGKKVNVFYESGGKAYRNLGTCLDVDDIFMIIEDPLQGLVYIGIDSITKIDFQSELDLKGGHDEGKEKR